MAFPVDAKTQVNWLVGELQPRIGSKKKEALDGFDAWYFLDRPALSNQDIWLLLMGDAKVHKGGLMRACGDTALKSFGLKKAAGKALGLMAKLMSAEDNKEHHEQFVHVFMRVYLDPRIESDKMLSLGKHESTNRGNSHAAARIREVIRLNEPMEKKAFGNNAGGEAVGGGNAGGGGKAGIMSRLAAFFGGGRSDEATLRQRGVLKQQSVFGNELSELKANGKLNADDVPVILEECCGHMRAEKITELQGLFRVSGSSMQIQELKRQFNYGEAYDLDQVDPHSVSGLVKLFFREMPEPLLKFKNYSALVGAQKSGNFDVIYDIVKSLPALEKKALEYLCHFLCDVAVHKQNNMMTEKNLAIVFAPNLIRPEVETFEIIAKDSGATIEVIKVIIEHYRDTKYEGGDTVAALPKVERKRETVSHVTPAKRQSVILVVPPADEVPLPPPPYQPAPAEDVPPPPPDEPAPAEESVPVYSVPDADADADSSDGEELEQALAAARAERTHEEGKEEEHAPESQESSADGNEIDFQSDPSAVFEEANTATPAPEQKATAVSETKQVAAAPTPVPAPAPATKRVTGRPSMSIQRSEPIPEDWMEVLDPSSGDPYYFAPQRAVTQWEKPLGLEPGLLVQRRHSDLHEGWVMSAIESEWSTEQCTAGGCYPNFSTWRLNPQFRLCLEAAETAQVELVLKWIPDVAAPVVEGKKKKRHPAFGMYVFWNDGDTMHKCLAAREDMVARSPFKTSGDVSCSFDAKSTSSHLSTHLHKPNPSLFTKSNFPSHYTILPTTFEPGTEGKFRIEIHSSVEVYVKKVTRAETLKETAVDGAWEGASMGGCRNHATFLQNPQIILSDPNLGPPKQVVALLAQGEIQDIGKMFPIGFYVKRNTGKVVAKAPFMVVPEVSISFLYNPNEAPYTIVPCTFEPGCNAQFSFSVYESAANQGKALALEIQ